jgi:hypothetical protein
MIDKVFKVVSIVQAIVSLAKQIKFKRKKSKGKGESEEESAKDSFHRDNPEK